MDTATQLESYCGDDNRFKNGRPRTRSHSHVPCDLLRKAASELRTLRAWVQKLEDELEGLRDL